MHPDWADEIVARALRVDDATSLGQAGNGRPSACVDSCASSLKAHERRRESLRCLKGVLWVLGNSFGGAAERLLIC